MTDSLPEIAPLDGVLLATAASGTGYLARDDMMLIAFEATTTVAGALTRSTTPAAPVRWTRARLEAGDAPRALIVNAGNANCFTGSHAFELVAASVAQVAQALSLARESVYVCSTGRIGERIDEARYLAALEDMAGRLAPADFRAAARSIMTTDQWPKARVRVLPGGARLVGITKGATMIAPNMATTLTFLFTDAGVEAAALQAALTPAVAETYDCVSVDNTTSTNDSLLCFATGKAGPVAEGALASGLCEVLEELSGELLRDGRRAGKLLSIEVTNAASVDSARRIARSVANSALVRRCLAERPPFVDAPFSPGRVMAAIGGSLEPVRPDEIEIRIGGTTVLVEGAVVDPLPEAALERIDADEISLGIDVAVGDAQGRIRTALVG